MKPRPLKKFQGVDMCRVCGCTEFDACADGCSWVQPDLCSTCQRLIDALKDFLEVSHSPYAAGVLRAYQEAAGQEGKSDARSS